MQLLVATNWDPALISKLGDLKDDIQLYGVLPRSTVGSGGSGPNIGWMTEKQAEEYIQQAHSAGLKFDYLLNAPSLCNMEWNDCTHRELLEHLDWVSNMRVDSVTVTIPYLLELIKSQFPNLKARVSTIAHVDSVARAKFFESLGADSITLDAHINRNFKVLKAIRNAVKCELNILVNNLCLYQCPYEYYHHDTMGHASQSYNPANGCYADYCVIRCTLDRLRDASEVIKSRWVRPEDLSLYEEIGIDFFKISGRSMSTERILTAAVAYSSRHCNGNLYDILNVLTPKSGFVSSALSNTTIGPPPKINIDNRSLEGFIDFFKKQDCLSGCDNCHYCQNIADKAIQFDRNEVNEYISKLVVSLENLSSSKVFSVNMR